MMGRRERLPLVVGAGRVARAVQVVVRAEWAAEARSAIDRLLASSPDVRSAVQEQQSSVGSTYTVQLTGDLHAVSGVVVVLAELKQQFR